MVYGRNMGTFMCLLGQRSHIKFKGHLRSSWKIAKNPQTAPAGDTRGPGTAMYFTMIFYKVEIDIYDDKSTVYGTV